MKRGANRERLEELMLAQLDSAYNLARWLTGNDHDSQDVVQESYMRALQYFDQSNERHFRAWILKTVRNTCYTWLKKNRRPSGTGQFDEGRHSHAQHRADTESCLAGDTPEELAARRMDGEALRAGIAALAPDFREVVVLRDLEGLSYREIADVAEIPIGTVMSRLMRGREALRREILRVHERGNRNGM